MRDVMRFWEQNGDSDKSRAIEEIVGKGRKGVSIVYF
jgi:hypothetical protein